MADVEPVAFRAARVELLLAEDPLVAEAGLRVHVRGERVVLSGCVGSAARRERALELARHEFPEFLLVDEMTDTATEPPAAAELLP